jgi:hypothetical protein
MEAPNIEELKCLHDKNYAMLTEPEKGILDFYILQGRKYNVSVSITSDVDPEELARAKNRAHADQILKRANSFIRVNIMR